MELLKQQVEALIFCSEQNISLEEIAASLKISFDWDVEEVEIINAINELKEKYLSDDFAFELCEISEGYQFLTKKQYHATVSALIQHKAKKKLSVSQMETLAIIAYRQPIAKSEVEHIRGVSCDYAVQKLLEKELIEITGKSEGPGRPVLYSTSKVFMDYFGIKSVKDLPQLKDLHMEQNEIGQPTDDNYSENIPPVEESVLSIENIEITPDEIIEESSKITLLRDEESDFFEDVAENDQMQDRDLQDLPDRKSIYIENELKNENEEENIRRFEDSEDN